MSADSYFLASYADAEGSPRAGIVVDEQLVDVGGIIAGAGPVHAVSTLDVLARWGTLHPQLKRAAGGLRAGTVGAKGPSAVPLQGAALLAPVLYPGAIFCAGANYKDHVAEMSRALNLPVERDPHELGLKPWHFMKPAAACVRGTGVKIALPAYSKKVDWEAEIALVIGKPCRNVSIESAMDYIAGFSVVNDLSARDHLRRPGVASDSPFYYDWVSQKAFDGALPFGPWICPLEFMRDVNDIKLKLWVNDELMQDSSSTNLIFSMAEQIAHLSTRLTLMPGDLIATGTPAGCGSARGRFLQSGDTVRVWVEGIGEISNEYTA